MLVQRQKYIVYNFLPRLGVCENNMSLDFIISKRKVALLLIKDGGREGERKCLGASVCVCNVVAY